MDEQDSELELSAPDGDGEPINVTIAFRGDSRVRLVAKRADGTVVTAIKDMAERGTSMKVTQLPSTSRTVSRRQPRDAR